METIEKKLTAEESILYIQQMITNAKTTMYDNSIHYLLWGWLSFIASLGNYFLLKTEVGQYSYLIWILLPLIGIPLSIYKQKKNTDKTETHLGFFIKNLWTGFGITSAIMFVLIYLVNFQIIMMFLLLFGTALFITGATTKFKPIIVGAIFFWAGAICSAFIKSPFDQLLIYAISIFAGYIVPGYILKYQYRKQHV
jgi:hypothetical protein